MKNTVEQNTKARWFKPVVIMACAAVLTAMATACGNKNGSSAPAAVPILGPAYTAGMLPNSCSGCPGNMTFLANAIANYGGSSPIAEMGVDFYGDGSVMMQSGYSYGYGYNPAYPMGYMGSVSAPYRGPFAAIGYIFIGQNLDYCGVPGGIYNLQTVQPGIWGNDGSGRSFDNIVMMAVGAPFQIQIAMSGYTTPSTPPARGTRDGRTYPYRFTATTLVVKRADMPTTCDLSYYMQ